MIKIGLLCSLSLQQKCYSLMNYDTTIQLSVVSYEKIKDTVFDCIIFEMKDKEAFQVYRQYQEKYQIETIFVFEQLNYEVIEIILKHHLLYYCLKDTSILEMYVLILRIVNENPILKTNIYDQIEAVLQQNGFPKHLNGYQYMKTLLLYRLQHPFVTVKMKDLYQITANFHQTTASRVEKSLRKVIEESCKAFNRERLSNARSVNDLIEQLERNQK